jgi:hypothetical protein
VSFQTGSDSLWYAMIVHGGGWSKLVSTSRIRIPVHFLILGLLFRACLGLASAQVPLPATLSIEAPGADVPSTDAAFSGAWGNSGWDGNIPTALVVERVDADGTADVIYASGAAEHPKVAANWLHLQGRIEDHTLTLRLPEGAQVQYHLTGPGPHPSPHFVANRSPPNSPLLTSISANRRISGSSRCSGMFGISS